MALVCDICGCEKKRPQFRKRGSRLLCKCCIEKYYREEKICVSCGRSRKSRLSEKNGGPLCGACYLRHYKTPSEVCSICKDIRPVYKRSSSGVVICSRCYVPPKEVCSVCGRIMVVNSRVTGNPQCIDCVNKERYKNDWKYSTKIKLRANLGNALRGRKVRNSEEYGIDYNKIVEFLGPPPEPNYHVDHIIPISAFDFSKPKHIKAAFSPENHRWLESKENLSKHAKYNIKDLYEYLSNFEDD